MAARAAVVLLGLGLAACGTGAEQPRSGAGELEVRQEFTGEASYIEGSYSYVRITGADGAEVAEEQLPAGDMPPFERQLPTGRYTLESWQRPCQGYCSDGSLGPATDRCSAEFQLESARRLGLRIEVSPGRGCEIAEDGSEPIGPGDG